MMLLFLQEKEELLILLLLVFWGSILDGEDSYLVWGSAMSELVSIGYLLRDQVWGAVYFIYFISFISFISFILFCFYNNVFIYYISNFTTFVFGCVYLN